jgi:3-methyl-2-oxobutanoate hydroxymethyltransferase
MSQEKITILDLGRMKAEKNKIVMITAYDYPFARIFSDVGVDVILVGDSVGNVSSGYDSTLPVTMDEMIYHTRAVSRANPRALVVGDMPFMSYHTSTEDAIRNAGRFLKEAGAQTVKLEGGVNVKDRIRAIADMDIPVMGHIGLTPQSVHRMGGFKVQGKDEKSRRKLIEDAQAVEDAGAFAIVLEAMPADLAKDITGMLSIPTIGIGAGVECDGQVLVMHDILGLAFGKRPKFVKQYADLKEAAGAAVGEFITEVREGRFPTVEYTYEVKGTPPA